MTRTVEPTAHSTPGSDDRAATAPVAEPGRELDEPANGVLGGFIGGAVVGTCAGLLEAAGVPVLPALDPAEGAEALTGTLALMGAGGVGGAAMGGVAGGLRQAVRHRSDASDGSTS